MNRILILSVFFLVTQIIFCQSLEYFGTAYNVTQQAGGPLFISIDIENDGSVTGFLDADEYPGQISFCGAGNFTGNIENNNLVFSFVNNDVDLGCGFINGSVSEFNLTFSNNFQTIEGTYFLNFNNSNGVVHARREEDCANLFELSERLNNSIGSSEEMYIRQFRCLAEQSCNEFMISGEDGWAGGFVRYLFDYISSHNVNSGTLNFNCPPLEPNEYCFTRMGIHHFVTELVPAFMSYCEQVESEDDIIRWTNDHEQFLSNSVQPCFDELIISDDICSLLPNSLCASLYLNSARESTLYLVRKLREYAQNECRRKFANESIQFLYSLNEDYSNSVSPPTFVNDGLTDIDIIAQEEAFVTGNSYQLDFILNGNPVVDLSDYNIALSVDSTIATLSDDGVISIMSSPYNLSLIEFPIYIAIEREGDFGLQRFFCLSNDEDQDMITSSYELSVGLNPFFANQSFSDSDFDGLIDFTEAMMNTSPFNSDTDFDGFVDPFEYKVRTDALNPDNTPIDLFITSVENFPTSLDVNIFPNPATHNVRINIDNISEELNLEIYNFNGQQVFEKTNLSGQNELGLDHLPSGVYNFIISNNQYRIVKRIVKI